MKQIKAVLFDLFDTLLLIRVNENIGENCLKSVYKFLSTNGINVSFNDFRRVYSEVRSQIYERMSRNFEEPHFSVRVSQTLIKLGYNYDSKSNIAKGAADAYSEEFSRYIYLDEDAIQVLRSLRSDGHKTGVISNFAIPECVHRLTTIYGLRELLDIIVVSAEVNKRKPSPYIFEYALNLLGVNASEAIFIGDEDCFIGDTPDIDIRGAKNVGMKTVLIERKSSSLKEEDKPDFTIKRLSDILKILKGE
ncbi:MAG: HAD family hydrolase [Candidatus Bathyarchaeia archaeon]